MKKVLVTGTTGYLGGRLCYALIKQGYSVRAFVRSTSELSGLLPPTIHGAVLELAYGDVTDYQLLLDAFSGCDIIFHAAAAVDPYVPDSSRIFKFRF